MTDAPAHEPKPAEAETGDLAASAARGALWSAAESWGTRVVTTLVFVVLARTLDPDDFGLVALALVFVELGNRLVHQGFGASIVQRATLDDEHLDAAFWLSVGAGVALALVAVATAPVLEAALGADGLQPVLQVLAVRYLFDALSSAQQSILQRELRFGALALRRVTATMISGAVAVALALRGAGVWSLVTQILVQQAVGVVFLWSASSWHPRLRFSRRHLRDLSGFSAGVTGIAMLRFLQREGEHLIVAGTLSPAALGFYSVGERFPKIVNETFTRTVGRVTFPVLSRMQADRDRTLRAVRRAARSTSFVAGPAFVALAVFAPQVLDLVVGRRWEAAIPVMRLLAVLGFVRVQAAFLADVVMASGRIGGLVRLHAVLAAIKVAAVAVAASHGLTAVAGAVLGAGLVDIASNLRLVARVSGLAARPLLVPLVRPVRALAAATGPMIAVAAAPLPTAALTLAIGLVVGAATYVAAVRLLAPDLIGETIDLLRRAAPRRALAPTGPR